MRRLALLLALASLAAAPAAGAGDRDDARALVAASEEGYRQWGRAIELGQAAFDARIVRCPAWRFEPRLVANLADVYTELSWASIAPRLVAPLARAERRLAALRPRDAALRAGAAALRRDRSRALARHRLAPRGTDVCRALDLWAATGFAQDFDVLAATGFPRPLYARIARPPAPPARDVRALNALHRRLLALGIAPAVASTFRP